MVDGRQIRQIENAINSVANSSISLKFGAWVRDISAEVAQWLKSTYREIQNGGLPPNFQSLNCYSSPVLGKLLYGRKKIENQRIAKGWVSSRQIFTQKGTSPTNYFCTDS